MEVFSSKIQHVLFLKDSASSTTKPARLTAYLVISSTNEQKLNYKFKQKGPETGREETEIELNWTEDNIN